MKNRKWRIILGYLISIMPTNYLRVSFYRALFGYRIHKSYIGLGTVIVVNQAELIGCHIGRNNLFKGPMNMVIKKGASTGTGNNFICGWWTGKEKLKKDSYQRYLCLEEKARIGADHFFDTVGSIILDEGASIAGRSSQFWTHGSGHKKRNIHIGKHTYIGSASRFAPGSSVGDNCIVGMGSVLMQEFKIEGALIGGYPAKILSKNYDWQGRKIGQ